MAENNITTAFSPRQTLSGQKVLRISGSDMKIATWNVNTLNKEEQRKRTLDEEKLFQITKIMMAKKIDILGIGETHLPEHGVKNLKLVDNYGRVKNYYFYYSNNSRRKNGVAIIVNKDIKKIIKNFRPYSDRICLLQLRTSPVNINIIQVYVPTSDKKYDKEIDNIYQAIKKMIKMTKKQDINIIMGDFNAKVGQGRSGLTVGNFGLGDRNPRGDRLVQFCQEENFVVINTFFELDPRKLYTWTSPKFYKNQIDYILVNQRFRNIFKSVKSITSKKIQSFSDHNLLLANIKIRLKTIRKKTNSDKIDITKLKNSELCRNVEQDLRIGFEKIGELEDIKTLWTEMKQIVVSTEKKYLTVNKREKKQTWMTDEILQLMKEKQDCKSPNRKKSIHQSIRSKIRIAKERWMLEKCQELEELQQKHDTFNLHKKIKDIAGWKCNPVTGFFLDNKKDIATKMSDKLNVWETYIEELFHDDRPEDHDINEADTGSENQIQREEVERVIRQAKVGKAPGSDNVYSEILKLMDSNGIDILTRLFNSIYTSGMIPEDWLKSTFVTLPTNAKRCGEHKTISLISHVLKLFLKIIHARIYRKCEETINKTQFGFNNGFGTREALFCMQVYLQQVCIVMQKNIYLCFIDYEKAFEKVRHGKLIEILQSIDLDNRDIRIIANLYWGQTASVKINGQLSRDISIQRGVRQGCVLSPLLFNIYFQAIFNETTNNDDETIFRLRTSRYLDDVVLFSESAEDLQEFLEKLDDVSNKYGLKINIKKTKFMIISKEKEDKTHVTAQLKLGHKTIEQVRQHKYLGTWLNDQLNFSQECGARIEQARDAFLRLQKLLTNRSLNVNLRIRMIKYSPYCCMDLKAGQSHLSCAKDWRLSRCGCMGVCFESHGRKKNTSQT